MDISPFDVLLVLFTTEQCLDCDITEAELHDGSLAAILIGADYEEAEEVLTLVLTSLCYFPSFSAAITKNV